MSLISLCVDEDIEAVPKRRLRIFYFGALCFEQMVLFFIITLKQQQRVDHYRSMNELSNKSSGVIPVCTGTGVSAART